MRWAVVRQLSVIAALALVAVILWIDIATGLWQDYVILSGLAAGVVTFILTALIVDRVISRSTHRRWAPVTRLALTDLLHTLADEEGSEIAHGKVVPRLIDPIAGDAPSRTLAELRESIVTERRTLTDAIALWSTFLASSADATELLDNAAEVAERLDLIRDAALGAESAGARTGATGIADLNREIGRYNAAVESLVSELRRQIAATERIEQIPLTTGR
ncbi:MAG TPA: hypothetical protein VFN24_08520 [Microbacterium sp.]|nr:hypothetical protein [Microbacterium sp.]